MSFCSTNASGRRCLLYTSDAADEEDSVDLGGRRIIKNLLLRLYFKILSRQTEIIHQLRGRLSHAVTERAVGKWCQRLPLAFVLQKDILSSC